MKKNTRPNIVFILTDQMRWDCLGVLGHPVVKTPNLDRMAREGTVFTAAYSSCPSCIAARASIFTGQRPTTHGRLGYQDKVPWNYKNTLAEVLSNSGYQTHCVGKTHFYPQKLPLGFETQDSYECLQNFGNGYVNDYFKWLEERTDIKERDHGLGSNSWVGGASVLPEKWHNNSWVVTRGIDFLKRREKERPFFLNLSFHRPHAPLDPPSEYLEIYKDSEIPPVPGGDWAEKYNIPVTDKNAWCGHLNSEILAESRKAYYAQISHIDAKIGHFMQTCEEITEGPTWYIFTSDHGEMLGDHNLFRKTYAYEGSAKIPMIILPPEGSLNHKSDAPVLQEDIMPTILEAADIEIPESVEGSSMLPLTASTTDYEWRNFLHGEHSNCYNKDHGVQYLTDGKEKYIWYTSTGEEQFFDLFNDPNELHNLAEATDSKERVLLWRERMIAELAKRPEDGLSDGKKLLPGKSLPPVRSSLLQCDK